MNKSRKLQRYEQKDYTQLVDFPVEIVGRDGVVRRYSYDESIRLYQRRIASAQSRYADGDVIDAEVVHCRQRIGQLRRSYFARYGWSALRVADRPGLLAGEFAGEVAAFLANIAAENDAPGSSAGPVRFALLEDAEHHQLYGIRHGNAEEGPIWLLAVYRFSASSSCAGRDHFFRSLKVVQSVATTQQTVEQLLGFHHTSRCGLILTSTDAPIPDAPPQPPGTDPSTQWLEFAAVDGDPLQAAFAALRRGRLSDALALFSAAYEAQPFRRAAYVGAGVVADQLGAFEAAQTAALMGVRYLPHDDFLRYQLALVCLRLGRTEEARRSLEPVMVHHPSAPAPRLLAGLVHLADDRWLRGFQHIRQSQRLLRDRDPDLQHAVQHLLTAGGWASVALVGGLCLTAVPSLLVALDWPLSRSVMWPLQCFTGLTTATVLLLARRRLQGLIRAPSGWGLRISNPQCLRASTSSTSSSSSAR